MTPPSPLIPPHPPRLPYRGACILQPDRYPSSTRPAPSSTSDQASTPLPHPAGLPVPPERTATPPAHSASPSGTKPPPKLLSSTSASTTPLPASSSVSPATSPSGSPSSSPLAPRPGSVLSLLPSLVLRSPLADRERLLPLPPARLLCCRPYYLRSLVGLRWRYPLRGRRLPHVRRGPQHRPRAALRPRPLGPRPRHPFAPRERCRAPQREAGLPAPHWLSLDRPRLLARPWLPRMFRPDVRRHRLLGLNYHGPPRCDPTLPYGAAHRDDGHRLLNSAGPRRVRLHHRLRAPHARGAAPLVGAQSLQPRLARRAVEPLRRRGLHAVRRARVRVARFDQGGLPERAFDVLGIVGVPRRERHTALGDALARGARAGGEGRGGAVSRE